MKSKETNLKKLKLDDNLDMEIELSDFVPEQIKMPYIDDIPEFFEAMDDSERFDHMLRAFDEYFKSSDNQIVCWIVEFEHSDSIVNIVIEPEHALEIAQQHRDACVDAEDYERASQFRDIIIKLESEK